jgi:uncharacterized integral membrane protein
MRLRTVVVIFAFLLVAVFVAINWSAFVTPTTLSLAFTSVEAPLGIVMLGILVLFALGVAVYMALWQSRTLLDLRRHTKELHEQRALADQAEASRFTELRGVVHAEIERLGTQLAMNQAAIEKEVREQANAISAAVAELDDRLRRSGVAT